MGSLTGLTSGVSALAGLPTEQEDDAEEYMSIMGSYAFTMDIVRRTGLQAVLQRRSLGYRLLGWKLTAYRLYLKMNSLFSAEFSVKSGNITMTFLDTDRDRALRVLSAYIALLRQRLQEREVASAESAVRALSKEAERTPDTQLQAAIYDIIARQLQRRDLAQVQADFSFRVIEPPVAPEWPDVPSPVLATVAVVVFVPALLMSGLIAKWRLEDANRREAGGASEDVVASTHKREESGVRQPWPAVSRRKSE